MMRFLLKCEQQEDNQNQGHEGSSLITSQGNRVLNLLLNNTRFNISAPQAFSDRLEEVFHWEKKEKDKIRYHVPSVKFHLKTFQDIKSAQVFPLKPLK